MKKIKNNNYFKILLSFVMLTLGSFLAALALETFLIPNTILDGGVTGVSIIISKLSKLPMSLLVLVLNIPFVYVGYKNLGKRFLARTVYSMILFSIFLEDTGMKEHVMKLNYPKTFKRIIVLFILLGMAISAAQSKRKKVSTA